MDSILPNRVHFVADLARNGQPVRMAEKRRDIILDSLEYGDRCCGKTGEDGVAVIKSRED